MSKKFKATIYIETDLTEGFDLFDAITQLKETVEKAQEFSTAYGEVSIPATEKMRIV